MNIWDWLILAALILVMIPAVKRIIAHRKGSPGCCGDCVACNMNRHSEKTCLKKPAGTE